MSEPNYFVVVFGNPSNNGDPVESGRYSAGEGYPQFKAEPGDMLLLYCTDGYTAYPRQIPGIGVAFKTSGSEVEYRWVPLVTPIRLEQVVQQFESGDRQKMRQLGLTARRVFTISPQSFRNTVAGQALMLMTAVGQNA